MGGFGSGRSGGSPTTEAGIVLDISHCMRGRYFRPGQHTAGSMQWSWSQSKRAFASVQFEANMLDPEDAWVRLDYVIAQACAVATRSLMVGLVTTQPHFGGRRWWFRCPQSLRRVRCLHMVGGAFASRDALGLDYQVQRESPKDQRLRAAQAADAKLGGDGNLLARAPGKPKWMRWRTYWRLVEERDRAVLKSLLGAIAVYDTPGVRGLINEAKQADPDLVAGLD